MGKRKEDQWRDYSSSSSLDAKRRRPRRYHHGRPNDGTPQDFFGDMVIELKDAILVKFSTEEKIKRKFEKLKEKRKKDKYRHEEDLRSLKEELRILKKGHEDLKSKIQDMQKEGCAEVDHYKASTSERSQLSQSTRFRLVIENTVRKTIYKNETVETEDGVDHIRVIMYDGGKPIAPDHPLSSAKVDLVVIEGRFNEPRRDSWSKEDFDKSIIKPREGMIRLVKNGTFDLIGGRRDHQGAIIMDNSQKKEVKLGLMIAVHTEERVLEGVSNPFKVQEGKTKRSQNKGKQPSPSAPTLPLCHSTSDYSKQYAGEGLVCADEPHCLPPPLEKAGAALNHNGQNFSQQLPAQMGVESASPNPLQHGQDYSWPAPNDLHAPGYFPVNQPLLASGHDDYTSLSNGNSELAYHNPSNCEFLNGFQSACRPEDLHYLNAQTQTQQTFGSSKCDQVLLPWDEPHMVFKERWRFEDQPVPLYSSKTRLHRESLPFKKRRSGRYHLRFVNKVCNDYYTQEQIKTEDGTFLRVALYDENNLVVTSGPLSSASVEVVLLHGDFNEEGQDHWRPEKFSVYIMPRDGNLFSGEVQPVFESDHLLALTNGEADLRNIIFWTPSSDARTGKFKIGVKIQNLAEEFVQEGITSPFVVRCR